jgi:tetratricopeptide (TPR) repeat protein
MNKMLSLSVGAMLLVAPLAVLAAETVPDAGIRAEMAGQWDEAVGVYRKSLDNNPAQAHLWVRIANIRARQKNFTAARDALNEAIRYAPRDPVPYAKLSEVHAVLNEPQQALAAINRAVELEPKNIQFLKVRGVQGAWNKDYQTASDSFSRVLALDPKDSEAKLGLARATVQLGNKDRGVKEYQAYLAGNPQDRVALMEYIELEAARANLPGVRQYGKLYRERFGEDMNYWLRMADNYALAGDDRASADAIQQATRLAPNDHALFYRLAQSYPSVEDVRPAMAAIERAVALEPKNIEYLRARADLAAWGGRLRHGNRQQ